MTRKINKKVKVEHKPGEFIEIDTGGLPLSEAFMTLDGRTLGAGDNGFMKEFTFLMLRICLFGTIASTLIFYYLCSIERSEKVEDINTRLIVIEEMLKGEKKDE